MHKLVNVLRVSELEPGEAIERELALIKVAALAGPARRAHRACSTLPGPSRRSRAALARFEIVGDPEEIYSFEELVRPHGLKELVRTGRIGLDPYSCSRPSP